MWFKAFSLARLRREQRCVIEHADQELLVLELDGVIYALDNLCPHQAMSLDHGLLDPEDLTLTCLHHHWCFRLNDGQGTNNRARVRTYPTKVEAGAVWIEVEE